MAGSSLLALIDDIATVLDDVALLTKVAAAPFLTQVTVLAGAAVFAVMAAVNKARQ